MSVMTTGGQYIRAMTATGALIDAVRPEQWRNATPCSEWNVRDVANHIIGENLWAAELLKGRTIAEVGNRLDGDLTGDDPSAAYRASALALASQFRGAGVFGEELPVRAGADAQTRLLAMLGRRP